MMLKCLKNCKSTDVIGNYSDSCDFKAGKSYDFHYYAPIDSYTTNDDTGKPKWLTVKIMKEYFEPFNHGQKSTEKIMPTVNHNVTKQVDIKTLELAKYLIINAISPKVSFNEDINVMRDERDEARESNLQELLALIEDELNIVVSPRG